MVRYLVFNQSSAEREARVRARRIPGSARVSRVGDGVSLSRTFRKLVLARRQNRRARRARYPEARCCAHPSSARLCALKRRPAYALENLHSFLRASRRAVRTVALTERDFE